MSESNEVAGHKWRLAQARRLIRFCTEQGLDPETVDPSSLGPILDADGKIIPEPEDIRTVEQGRV